MTPGPAWADRGPAAVIFDLDGTLIDSAPDIHRVANLVLAGEGLGAITLAEARSFVGNGLPVFVTRMLAARGTAPDAARHGRMVARMLALYAESHDLTRLYPGVRAALDALAAAGHRLGICTNKPEAPARAVLGHFGLDGVFAVVVGGDTLAARKPDPAPLHHAVGRLGGGPALFVGDSEVDAETAAAAGVPFALFAQGYRKAAIDTLPHQALFRDFAELPALAARLLLPARPAAAG